MSTRSVPAPDAVAQVQRRAVGDGDRSLELFDAAFERVAVGAGARDFELSRAGQPRVVLRGVVAEIDDERSFFVDVQHGGVHPAHRGLLADRSFFDAERAEDIVRRRRGRRLDGQRSRARLDERGAGGRDVELSLQHRAFFKIERRRRRVADAQRARQSRVDGDGARAGDVQRPARAGSRLDVERRVRVSEFKRSRAADRADERFRRAFDAQRAVRRDRAAVGEIRVFPDERSRGNLQVVAVFDAVIRNRPRAVAGFFDRTGERRVDCAARSRLPLQFQRRNAFVEGRIRGDGQRFERDRAAGKPRAGNRRSRARERSVVLERERASGNVSGDAQRAVELDVRRVFDAAERAGDRRRSRARQREAVQLSVVGLQLRAVGDGQRSRAGERRGRADAQRSRRNGDVRDVVAAGIQRQRSRARFFERSTASSAASKRSADAPSPRFAALTESVPLFAEKTEPSPAETFVRETV